MLFVKRGRMPFVVREGGIQGSPSPMRDGVHHSSSEGGCRSSTWDGGLFFERADDVHHQGRELFPKGGRHSSREGGSHLLTRDGGRRSSQEGGHHSLMQDGGCCSPFQGGHHSSFEGRCCLLREGGQVG